MVNATPESQARLTRMLGRLELTEQIPRTALRRRLATYDASVRQFFVGSFEADGTAGFLDAFRLIDVLEALGCRHVVAYRPEILDPIRLLGRKPDTRPFDISVPRGAWTLSRQALATIIRCDLGLGGLTQPLPDSTPLTAPQGEFEDDAASATEVDLVLSGKLSQMPFPDLVQMLRLQRKTGALRLGRDGGVVGTVYFDDGEMIHATAPGLTGEAAIQHIAAIRQAVFAFITEAPDARTIRRPTAAVLMDAMRRVDEERAE
ncbi:MAG: DUF4388 domain-containing protein [Planctomycetota bacterium]|jgi:hypothetical protein